MVERLETGFNMIFILVIFGLACSPSQLSTQYMLYIILDTNIIFNNWRFGSEASKSFTDFLGKTDSTVLVPRVVWQEIEQNYKEEFAKKQKAVLESESAFNKLLPKHQHIFSQKFDIQRQVEECMSTLKNFLRINNRDAFIEYDGDVLKAVANRAVQKRKPFNKENQREFKDAIIWETLLSLIRDKPNDRFVLISNDSNAFSIKKIDDLQGKRQLHPELIEDCKLIERDPPNYFAGIAEFVSDHHTPIKDITHELVANHINNANTEEVLLKFVIDKRSEFVSAIRALFPHHFFTALDEEIEHIGVMGIQFNNFTIYQYNTGHRFVLTQYATTRLSMNATVVNPGDGLTIGLQELLLKGLLTFSIPYIDKNLGIVTVDKISLIGKIGKVVTISND